MAKSQKSIPHRRTRSDHAAETAEDYVEAVAEIIADSQACRVADLAKRFGVSHVTVSKIVARLVSEELLTTTPYQPIELTDKGRKLAEITKKRHKIVFEFLIALGVDEMNATIDSEGIEHHVSEATLNAMLAFLKKK
ncbi:MAG: manganese-binding transcriptional regulator MntR [Planctomycetota bacterium]